MTPRDTVAIAKVRRMLADGTARARREEARITQTEMACALGVTHATISRWESGDRVPLTRYALAYASLLDLLGDEVAA
jgi:transcriptional regulator with XRE-family HTH domain